MAPNAKRRCNVPSLPLLTGLEHKMKSSKHVGLLGTSHQPYKQQMRGACSRAEK